MELVGLALNGDPLEARAIEKKSPNGDRTDYYHLCRLPSTSGRAMTVTATLRHIATGKQATKEFQFTSSPSP